MITRRGLTNGVLQAPLSGEKAIRALFNNGEQGVWYDPSDLSTLFQDAAGTTPVTAVGQPVGRMLDKSGRGNHATQATAASRPVLQQDAGGRFYLACDGVDDGMATASIDFTPTDKMTVWAGVRKLSDAAVSVLLELSASSGTNNGCFSIIVAASPSYFIRLYNVADAGGAASTYAAPITNTITASWDFSKTTLTSQNSVRIDGLPVSLIGGSLAASGNFANQPFYLFRRGGATLPFNGNFYGCVIRGAQSTPKQILQVEKYLAAKTGVLL